MIYKSIKLQVLKIKFSRVKINEEEVVAQWSTTQILGRCPGFEFSSR